MKSSEDIFSYLCGGGVVRVDVCGRVGGGVYWKEVMFLKMAVVGFLVCN